MTETAEFSSFWSWWVIAITLGSIFGCVWLLWVTRKSQKFDSETEETMGHSFDGIEEYDNPLPQWWMWMFLATIVFGLVYLALYPGLGNFKGLLTLEVDGKTVPWTQENQWAVEVAEDEKLYAPLYAELAAIPVEELITNDRAMKMGQRLFANNCQVCHGAAGRGSLGFPNLTDNDWLYGGTPDKIKETLHQGRIAAMPAWEAILGSQGIVEVAHYVRQMSGQETVDAELAAAGAPKFAANCAACHGADGTGMQLLGAPNLTDSIWLYGGTQNMVEMTLRNGRAGVMPAFQEKLGDDRIHIVAAYVYSLSRNN